MKMRENDFVREQRRPLEGSSAVGVSAAKKFVLTVGMADEFRVTKLVDDVLASALWN